MQAQQPVGMWNQLVAILPPPKLALGIVLTILGILGVVFHDQIGRPLDKEFELGLGDDYSDLTTLGISVLFILIGCPLAAKKE